MKNTTIGTIALGVGVVLSLGAFGVKAQQDNTQINEANGTWKGGGDTLIIKGSKGHTNGNIEVNVDQLQHKITFHNKNELEELRAPLTFAIPLNFATVIDYKIVDGNLHLKNNDNGYVWKMYKEQ